MSVRACCIILHTPAYRAWVMKARRDVAPACTQTSLRYPCACARGNGGDHIHALRIRKTLHALIITYQYYRKKSHDRDPSEAVVD